MTTIAFGGKKQSGKNTCAAYSVGMLAVSRGRIPAFKIREDCNVVLQNGEVVDPNDLVPDLAKIYSFATPLKEFCINTLGLDREKTYGGDADKNSLTHIRWETLPGVVCSEEDYRSFRKWVSRRKYHVGGIKFIEPVFCYHEPGYMTIREVLQYFGSDFCRQIYEQCWTSQLVNTIKREGLPYAFVADMRFDNEAAALKESGANLIYLTRQISEDSHKSEKGFSSLDIFDNVIDNSDGNVHFMLLSLIKTYEKSGVLAP